MTDTRPRLSGLHHVGVHTADPTRLLDFYRTVFDLRPVLLADDRTHASVYFELADGSALEVIPAATSGAEHIGFAVAERHDLLILRERLLAAGYRAGEVREVDSLCCVDFHDPDGRRGQLVWPGAQPSVRP